MIGEKFFRKSNLLECLIFKNTKLTLYKVTDMGDGENGFPTFTIERDTPDNPKTILISDTTLENKYIHYEDYTKLMEFISEELEKITLQAKSLKKEVLSMT